MSSGRLTASEHTAPSKRETVPSSASGPYRILALDGGGIRALLTLTLLERLEQAAPGLLRSCHLIAGTSAGGILALALADGIRPAHLARLLLDHANVMFQPNGRYKPARLRGLFSAVYHNRGLKQAMAELFGSRRLADLPRQVVLPSFALGGQSLSNGHRCWSPIYYHNLDDSRVGQVPIADAALYTSAAPCLFPAVEGHVDGGLTAANPSLLALTLTQDRQIRMRFRPELSKIALLSLGTGHFYRQIDEPDANWGLLQWHGNLISMMLQGGIMQVDQQCDHLLGDRYQRLDPVLSEDISANDLGRRRELVDIGRQADLGPTVDWLEKHFLAGSPDRKAAPRATTNHRDGRFVGLPVG